MGKRGVEIVPEVVWIPGSPTIHQGREAEIRISDLGRKEYARKIAGSRRMKIRSNAAFRLVT